MRARSSCVLLVALLVLPIATTITPSFCPTWNPMQTACPLAPDVLERLTFALEHEVAGQALASRTIEKAIARNVHRCMHATDTLVAQAYGAISEANLKKVYSAVTDVATSAKAVASSVGSVAMGFPSSVESAVAWISGHSSGESKSRPLFMHFSGPTGVGKTHTADIVAKSVLARPVDGAQNKEKDLCGKMAVQMRAFVSTAPEDIDANAQELRSKVAEQLYNCPRSVIIFDEIQSVPEDLLDKVIGMFDPGEGEALSHQIKTVFHPVNTSLCIVIAISDLGSTKLAPSMDREQAKRVIQEEADNRFVRSKKKALLNNIVPFLSLSVDELVKVVVMELKALRVNLAKEYKGVWAGKVTWSESAARWMAERCMADSTCYDDGGRGIETFVEHELLTMCEDALTQECFDKDSISYNNLDLYLEGDGEDKRINVKIDTVYDDTKEFKQDL